MFNSATTIEMTLAGAAGNRDITIRFPTDEEWLERQKKRKTIQRSLGKGESQTEVRGAELADGWLARKILTEQEQSEDISDYDGVQIIEAIGKCDVVDGTFEGGQFDLTMETPFGETKHTLKEPSQKQVFDYRRGWVRVVDGQFNTQELRINLRLSADFYDSLSPETEGYESPVPVIHKHSAIQGMLSVLDARVAENQRVGFTSRKTPAIGQ